MTTTAATSTSLLTEEMLERFRSGSPLDSLEPVTGEEEFLKIQGLVTEVHVEPALRNYIVQVVQATRRHEDVELGASPRASSANGIATRCAWRSAKRKVKKGNSVISSPGGSGGIMRLERQ